MVLPLTTCKHEWPTVEFAFPAWESLTPHPAVVRSRALSGTTTLALVVSLCVTQDSNTKHTMSPTLSEDMRGLDAGSAAFLSCCWLARMAVFKPRPHPHGSMLSVLLSTSLLALMALSTDSRVIIPTMAPSSPRTTPMACFDSVRVASADSKLLLTSMMAHASSTAQAAVRSMLNGGSISACTHEYP